MGLTATPDRQDKKPLAELFDNVSYVFGLSDAIRGGWLVPLRAQRVVVKNVDLRKVGTKGREGDFKDGELEDAMLADTAGIVDKLLGLASDRHMIAFWPGVRMAQLATECFNERTAGCAEFIYDKTPTAERASIVERFKKRQFSVLNNVGIATEGFDVPPVDCVALMRPTYSDALYAQMIGRGTRPLLHDILGFDDKDEAKARRERIATGNKPHLLILDFVGVVGERSLTTPVDILGSEHEKEVVDRAKVIIEGEQADPETVEGADPLAALNRAKMEIDELRALARSVKVTHVDADVYDVDPFAFAEENIDGMGSLNSLEYGAKPATDPQVRWLRKKGVAEDVLSQLSKRKASALFKLMDRRHEKGLATFNQLNSIKRHIAVSNTITFEAASAAMDYITDPSKPTDPRALERILYG